MLVNILLDRLKGQGYQFSYMGPEAAEIYAVQMLPDVSWEKDSEIIYVAPDDALKEASIAGSLTDFPCIFALGGYGDMERILEAVQRWLVDDIRRKDHLVKMQKDISEGRGVYELVRHCSKIMGNPVLFVNHALNIVCQYPETGNEEGTSACVADRVMQWRNTQGRICWDEGHRCQIQHVFYKNEGYYIYVIEKDSDFHDTGEIDYLQNICSMIDAGGWKGRKDEKAEINKVIVGLLQKRYDFPENEKNRLKLLGWKDYEKYMVLVVEKKPELSGNDVSRDLSDILNADIFVLGTYYVAILHSEKYVEYTERDFPKLKLYLEENGLIAVLSMGFFDIEDCAVRFEQCRDCLEIVSKEIDSGLRYYGRYQMTHFVKVMDMHNQIDLKIFCSPVILQIYEIDKKQKTDYLSTLYTYICSGQAMKYSADAMHIHVNTMYMRVSRLKDEFKIDFDDEHMIYTLHNSIVFLAMRDQSCLKNRYPYLS